MMNWLNNYNNVQKDSSFYELKDFCLLEVKGDDAEAVLQGQSTNDVKELNDKSMHLSSLLTPQGKIISHHFLLKINKNNFYLLCARSVVNDVKAHLEKHIIMEDADLTLRNELKLYHLYKLDASSSMMKEMGIQQVEARRIYEHNSQYLLTAGFLGLDSAILITAEKTPPALKLEMCDETFKSLRMEAGFPIQDADYNQSTLLPESGLQLHCVSYTKGCFTGQEIVARVKYRGNVNRYLSAILVDSVPAELKQNDFLCTIDGKKIGLYKSQTWSPVLKKFILYVYLNKKFREPGMSVSFIDSECQEYKGNVSSLPPVAESNAIELARECYYQALELFATSDEVQDIAAEPLLKRALYLDPSYQDAYEALGVLLSRHERFDEAIELMKRLKELSPNTVMAYTNLSVFYMKKGMIDEAEAEKQEGTLTTFRIAAAKRKQKINNKDLETAANAERERRRGMFNEVLEIDVDDLAANFGLGKIALELKQADEAIKYLEKCLELKRDYSVCCTLLARAYILVKREEEAKSLLLKGIVIAHEKGELMPKQEMEMLLQQLN
ncbi:tetratricopeptide repeat protein [Lentisphaera profundi]|uniref:Tetratricopeptide repeat protein n=1 Tax=Lentisphaera profundi TaxID=1658616 RepID=A0ABY7VXB3_9BACT|nr:tetratricopeptide repeat protein [Lentisphaera profundi]WDE97913.1 tetratricopeptide repeat protein [Lentisphaera profundi]